MSIFEKELISGRVSYDSLPDADASDFTYPFLELPGVVFSIGNTFFIRMYFMVKVVKKMLQEQMDLLLPTSKTLLNLVEEVLFLIPHVLLLN